MKNIKIIIEKHPDGYVAYPLGLKGVVVGEGDTYEEAMDDVKSAIKFHIETFGLEQIIDDDAPIMEVFIARQPILDREKKAQGYELLFRSGEENACGETDGTVATSCLMHNFLLSMGVDEVTGKKTAFILQTPLKPPDVYISGTAKFSPKQLTTTNPQAADFTLGEQEVIRWESSDGLEIEGILIKPIGYEPGKRYPLLLIIHGGPAGVWSDGYNLRNSRYPTQVFTGQGYAIIMPNPRGSTGYGEKHRRGNWKDLSGKEWDDCNTGVDKVIEMGIGDSDKLGIMGWSYGGHLTFWGIAQTDRYKAGSAGAGANNLISMYSQTDLPGFYSDTYFGFPPWHNYDFYWDRSSLKYVTRVKTPLLIQVGENDARVPKTQSIEYYTALSDLEVPTQLAIYPRQGHGIREPQLVKDLLQRNVDWFKKWILKK